MQREELKEMFPERDFGYAGKISNDNHSNSLEIAWRVYTNSEAFIH